MSRSSLTPGISRLKRFAIENIHHQEEDLLKRQNRVPWNDSKLQIGNEQDMLYAILSEPLLNPTMNMLYIPRQHPATLCFSLE
ncbi:hypothetical protein Trydic_g23960 [Trypoxylus dichotomus]